MYAANIAVIIYISSNYIIALYYFGFPFPIITIIITVLNKSDKSSANSCSSKYFLKNTRIFLWNFEIRVPILIPLY